LLAKSNKLRQILASYGLSAAIKNKKIRKALSPRLGAARAAWIIQ
jgi:hypothetical protein